MEQRFGRNRIEVDSKPDEKTEAAIGLPFPVFFFKKDQTLIHLEYSPNNWLTIGQFTFLPIVVCL